MIYRFSNKFAIELLYPELFWSPFLIAATLVGLVGILVLIRKRRLSILQFVGELIIVSALMITLSLVRTFPVLLTEQPPMPLQAVVDISKSIDQPLGEQLVKAITYLTGNDSETAWHAFAHYHEQLLASPEKFSILQPGFRHLDQEATDLQRVLESLPIGSSVVLASDGFPTINRENKVLELVKKHRLRIFPSIPKEYQQSEQKVEISQVALPLLAEGGKSIAMRITITNERAAPVAGTLRISSDKKQIHLKEVIAPSGMDLVQNIQVEAPEDGLRKFTLEFTPDDETIPPSSWVTHIAGMSQEEITIISSQAQEETLLRALVPAMGLQPIFLRATPKEPLGLGGDMRGTVILNNIPARSLTPSAIGNLQRFVKVGGRLIVIGGPDSFGLGGYHSSDLDRLLPVKSIPPRATQKRLNGAVVLVIDKSRSMADDDKLEFAKEAAREVIRNLEDDDYVGIIGFDATPFIVVRLDQLATSRSNALDRVSRLLPAGKTNLLPALDEARRALERVRAGRKHVIVLTDGRLPDAGGQYIGVVEEMRLRGITTSTVLIGDTLGDQFLRGLAKVGGGSSYEASEPSSLPRIFLTDIQVNVAEKTLQEDADFRVSPGPQSGKISSLISFPNLQGFVETSPREGADLDLVVSSSRESFPLLASWKQGAGTVLAFTSDASGRWTVPWSRWQRFGQFWHDVIVGRNQDPTQQKAQGRFDLRYETKGDRIHLEALVYNDLLDKPLNAQVKTPTANKFSVNLKQQSPGRYLGEILENAPGTYEILLQSKDVNFVPVAIELRTSSRKEAPGGGINIAFLQKLATASKGKINPAKDELNQLRQTEPARMDIRPFLLLTSVCLLLIAILLRESNSII